MRTSKLRTQHAAKNNRVQAFLIEINTGRLIEQIEEKRWTVLTGIEKCRRVKRAPHAGRCENARLVT